MLLPVISLAIFVTLNQLGSHVIKLEHILKHFLELQGKKIRVSKTQPKNRLFIGNVPKHWEKEEFEKIINQQGVGVTSIELLKVNFNPLPFSLSPTCLSWSQFL